MSMSQYFAEVVIVGDCNLTDKWFQLCIIVMFIKYVVGLMQDKHFKSLLYDVC